MTEIKKIKKHKYVITHGLSDTATTTTVNTESAKKGLESQPWMKKTGRYREYRTTGKYIYVSAFTLKKKDSEKSLFVERERSTSSTAI